MTATKTALDPSEIPPGWVSRSEAAKRLRVSERQIQRRHEEGFIRKQTLERRLDQKAATTCYNAEDIAAILANKPNKWSTVVPAAENASQPPAEPKNGKSTALVPAAIDVFSGLQAYFQNLNAQYVPPPPPAKPWLTLKEAADFSGLPAAWLKAAAAAGNVNAIKTGSGRIPNWRFHRDSLIAAPSS